MDHEIMAQHFVFTLLAALLVTLSGPGVDHDPYQTIKIEEIVAKLVVRNKDDRMYSGQIKSEAGLREFENACGAKIPDLKVNFKERMLIFGITDDISTQAFQFLKQEKPRAFTLDYVDTGIMYKLKNPANGKKYSFLQVFVLDRIDAIPHISVKNVIRNGLSLTYEGQSYSRSTQHQGK